MQRPEMTLRFTLGALCAPDGDSICRTAVYVTRTHGGVGGGGREAFPYPDLDSRSTTAQWIRLRPATAA